MQLPVVGLSSLFAILATSILALPSPLQARARSNSRPSLPAVQRALQKRQSLTTSPGNDNIVLNFALALEKSDFTSAGLPSSTRAEIQQIFSDETAHAEFLTAGITSNGGTPVQSCNYTFPYTSVSSFLTLASIVEGVGSSAYIGSLGAFTVNRNSVAGGTILGVEVRHNALLRYLNGENPNPAAQDTPLSAKAVTSLAAGFFVPNSCPQGSALPFTPFPALNVSTAAPVIGGNLTVQPAAPLAASNETSNGTFCAFATGCVVAYSPWDAASGVCAIPSTNISPGQTYLALTSSSSSISDSSILAGMGVFNLVNSTASPGLTLSSGNTSNSTGGGSGGNNATTTIVSSDASASALQRTMGPGFVAVIMGALWINV